MIFCILYFNIDVVNNFFNQRILALFHNSLSDSSSGRFEVWKEGYTFYSESNRLLFGVGYKADLFFTDNCYLFTLTSTGIFGLICFLWFLFALLTRCIQGNNRFIYFILFIGFVIVSLTCDVITYYRGMILMLSILVFMNKEKINIPIKSQNSMYLKNNPKENIVC